MPESSIIESWTFNFRYRRDLITNAVNPSFSIDRKLADMSLTEQHREDFDGAVTLGDVKKRLKVRILLPRWLLSSQESSLVISSRHLSGPLSPLAKGWTVFLVSPHATATHPSRATDKFLEQILLSTKAIYHQAILLR